VSDSQPANVRLFDNNDPEMQRAHEHARATFRYFWREIAWERQRIVPALDLACVKAPFFDDRDPRPQGAPEAEQMWLGEVDFDGRFVRGVLLNTPNWLKTVKEGDAARFRVDEISDWMFAIRGEVYGAYTVNLLRSRMTPPERQGHDEAWGLNFGDPNRVRVAYPLKTLDEADEEHPMSEAAAPSLRERLAKDSSLLSATGHNGWTLLHQHASAGSTAVVEALLEHGADVNAMTDQGLTPLQLARSLGWEKVVALLLSKGAT
jgi:uncharacterized protein YegJ (DUF2314 family)